MDVTQPTAPTNGEQVKGTNRLTEAAPDPFDPAALRISQDFAAAAGVEQVLTTIPVRKPNRHDFVRVHSSEDFQLTTLVVELKDERSEIYLVTSDIREKLIGEVNLVTLFLAINRQGVVFFWPCKLPDPSGRVNAWHESALEAAHLARDRWIRVSANMSLGAYQIFQATGELPNPEWPSESLGELLRIAFKGGKLIDAADHPVLKRLRGEA